MIDNNNTQKRVYDQISKGSTSDDLRTPLTDRPHPGPNRIAPRKMTG